MSPTRDRLRLHILVGMDPDELSVVEATLAFSLEDVVLVRHDLEPAQDALLRTVSDQTGVLERARVPLAHPCLTCALREEIVPTLLRVAAARPGVHAVVRLPLAADPAPVVRAIQTMTVGGRRVVRDLDVRGVHATTPGPDLLDDLLGDDLLRERDPDSFGDDARAWGEALVAQLEYADVILLTGGTWAAVPTDSPPTDATGHGIPAEQASSPTSGRTLLETLRRPDATVVDDVIDLDPAHLTELTHDHRAAEDWVSVTGRSANTDGARADRGPLTVWHSEDVWTTTLDTWRPLHPDRLMERLSDLGSGRVRGRGCFWLPTRPGSIVQWDGAGGQLSIGTVGGWGALAPRTQLVFSGTGTRHQAVEAGLRDALTTDLELARGLARWAGQDDPFDPWLGDHSSTA